MKLVKKNGRLSNFEFIRIISMFNNRYLGVEMFI